MERYQRFYLTEKSKPIKEDIKIIAVIPEEQLEQPVATQSIEPIEATKPVESKPTINHIPQPEIPEIIDSSKQIIDSNENLKNIVLMLNQILVGVNELTNNDGDSPIVESKQNCNQSVKRKIILNRDDNGKIIGADVIDSVEHV